MAQSTEELFERFRDNPLMKLAVTVAAGALIADDPIQEENLRKALATVTDMNIRLSLNKSKKEDPE